MLSKARALALTLFLVSLSALVGSGSMSTTGAKSPAPAPTQPVGVIMPKWLESPTLDGRCDDPSYAQAGNLKLVDMEGQPAAGVSLMHTGQDAYLCFNNLPAGAGQNIVVRVDSDHSRGKFLTAGDFEFSVSPDGYWCAGRGGTKGRLAPLRVPASDFTVVVPKSDQQTWSAELRLSLEWLGGYARTDGLSLALERVDGKALQRWPSDADARVPSTWGDLALGPLYPDSIQSGSAFFDGRDGYMVVPFSPELNPREITVEAWARVPEGGCGTLVGNGQLTSYWMALCNELRFTHAGSTSVLSGMRRLDDGWHHVAVTVNADGRRTFYVDGELDRNPDWRPAQEEPEEERKPAIKLGVSDRMLRLGSDRDAPAEQKSLHGYMRELRIWNRARSAQEIRDTAFRSLDGKEPGLVGLWPFTHGLQDLAGGHDAGLIGDASLARAAPDVTSFPPAPVRQPGVFPEPTPPPAWDAVIPLSSKQVRLDGVCSLNEYADAAELRLEPQRELAMSLLQTSEAIFLCTNQIWGQRDSREGLTLWINRGAAGGPRLGPVDLRIHLSPDGRLTVGTGDGQGFDGPAPRGIESKTISGAKFRPQEDVRTVNAPWFSGEVRIPLEALQPFKSGDRLRFALEYQATRPAKAFPYIKNAGHVRASWPSAFDPQRPETWGVAFTRSTSDTGAPGSVQTLGEVASNSLPSHYFPAPGQSVLTQLSDLHAPGGIWSLPAPPRPRFDDPPGAPTTAQYKKACPLSKDPTYILLTSHKWPLVDPDNHGIVRVEGLLSPNGGISVPVSQEDAPRLHSSHDLDMIMNVFPAYQWAVLDYGTSLVLETESKGFDPSMRPGIDDHMTVVGNWIFDCGHDPKTEIHPIYEIESDRLVTLPLLGAQSMQQFRVVRVSMNSAPGGARSWDLQPFSFTVDLPPVFTGASPGRKYFMRVRQGDPNMVSAQLDGQKLNITVTTPTSGIYAFELVIGNVDAPAEPGARMYEVMLQSIGIKDDHEPDSIPFSQDNGEWFFAAGVNGNWRQIFWDTEVETDDSFNFKEHEHSFFTSGPNLAWEFSGYEEDNLDLGDAITSGRFDIGPLAALAQSPGTHVLEMPDWVISYSVTDITDSLARLSPAQFPPQARPVLSDPVWASALVDEQNDLPETANKFDPLQVRPNTEVITKSGAYLTEAPDAAGANSMDNVRFFNPDVDWFKFPLSDYADINVEGAPSDLSYETTLTDANGEKLPPEVLDGLGAKGGTLKVSSSDGSHGVAPYSFNIKLTSRKGKEDWGEGADDSGGRKVYLTVGVPRGISPTVVIPANDYAPVKHFREMDWAWQHVAGDVDKYLVIMPAPRGRGRSDDEDCKYDTNARLEVWAGEMHLSIPALNVEGDGYLSVDLGRHPNLSELLVVVSGHSLNTRDAYQFSAQWTAARHYTPLECAVRLGAERRFYAVRRVPPGEPQIFFDPVRRGAPQEAVLTFWDSRAYEPLVINNGPGLDAIFSSPRDQTLIVRLYDGDGILLGEGEPPGGSSVDLSAGIRNNLTPQSHLRVEGLTPGMFYLLQLVSTTDAGSSGRPRGSRIALSPAVQ